MSREPVFLELDELLQIHEDQIFRYGGESGVRDVGLLISAAAQPKSTFGGQFLHRDLFDMAAGYMFHVIRNHPFIDGNKRTGLVAALVFLALNGITLTVSNDELAAFVLTIADGGADKPVIAEFLRQHGRTVSEWCAMMHRSTRTLRTGHS